MAEPPSERYVAGPELASIMGLSERTIKRMTAAGMPSETWGMSRCRRYLPSAAMAWASARSDGRIRDDNNPLATVRQRRDEPDHARHRNG